MTAPTIHTSHAETTDRRDLSIPESGLTERGGRSWYTVADVDRMPPFLMSVVSDGDRWMFASSTGALTAGRRDATGSLFPYETDDRLHAAIGRVGAVTRMRVHIADGVDRWVPFTDAAPPPGRRWLSKSVAGDAVEYAEQHAGASLVFRSRWASSERYGFVRTAELSNHGADPVRIELLDGLLGVLPPGIDPAVQQRYSNLANAYKRAEQLGGAGRLALFSLEAPVSDLAEPQEVLRASVVWSTGLPGASVSLDPAAPEAFDAATLHPTDPLVTGRRGAYLLRDSFEIAPGAVVIWQIVADVALDHVEVVELRQRLGAGGRLPAELEADLAADVERTNDRLTRLMAAADAQQHTGDPVGCAHHLANVTYNVMRGGLPLEGHQVDTADLASFVRIRNRSVAERHADWLASLPLRLDRRVLLEQAAEVGDPHLERLVRDDLPFSFSRRHGDPSRPWNAFSIRVQDAEGQPVVHYEGNWRDVFQNWEALCESYPGYLGGVVSVFANSSTADGHNPYRITRDGIDWEVPDPDDPWANIGYWGDHQLVYLLRLLEATDRVLPGEIDRLLPRRAFTYADVPYRIAGHDEMVRDPKNTIHFDEVADARVRDRMAELGGDGALVPGPDGAPLLVTPLEKLLVSALAKVSNFVPGGGIWMNTQRPEWNDANNALVGYGLSMVTLFHLRQYLDRLRRAARRVAASAGGGVTISAEVAAWLDEVIAVLHEEPVPDPDQPPEELAVHRRTVLRRLGQAATRYRATIAAGFSGEQVPVERCPIVELCDTTVAHLDATIRANRRPDRLLHSYNLLELDEDGRTARVHHLPEMLEGQVAALGSGALTPAEQAELLDSVFASRLHRADIDTFLLAPAIVPPSFLDKNVVPADAAPPGSLLGELLAAGDRSIVRPDAEGRIRFHPDLIDAGALDQGLDALAGLERWSELVDRDRSRVHDTYEAVFAHRAHLGRSGSMHAYEGTGSVYWHMVTKFLLAVQEATSAAADDEADPLTIARLVAAYWRVRDGLGVNRSAEEFGAIPTDPYSHTPAHAGAQQPGMTGAVKEEILTRRRELGVRVVEGGLEFDDLLLRTGDLLVEAAEWTVTMADGDRRTIELPAGSAGLTVCQVPVVIGRGPDGPHVEVHLADGRTVRQAGSRLGPEVARAVFDRTGEVELIRAVLAPAATG